MKEFPRLSAGVKYQEFEMKDDESPPRSAEESATRTISARLLSGPLTLGGGAKPSISGGDFQAEGVQYFCGGSCCCLLSRFKW